MVRIFLRSIALLICIFASTGCATVQNISENVQENTNKALFPKDGRLDYSLESGATVYIDAKTYLGDLVVNVAANRPLEVKPKALFLPLGMLQNNQDHIALSQGVSKLLWQQFLAEQTFQVLEFSNTLPPHRLENVIQGAKFLGADFVVGGYITYYLDGAGVGDSKIALQWEVYDVSNGALLWSINQSGILPYKTDQKNVIFTVHHRMPINSMSSLIAAMGQQVAEYLHHWTDPVVMRARMEAAEEKNNKGSSRGGPRAFGKY